MAPINTDVPSSQQGADISPSASPRSTSTSLQAAATLNAGLQRSEPVRRSSSSSLSRNQQSSPSAGRRRSQALINIQIADPSVPGPGEMVSDAAPNSAAPSNTAPSAALRNASPRGLSSSPQLSSTGDPHHHRTPSLGELHQELENEQEFQVNRLLQEISRLQLQVQRQQQSQSAVVDDTSDRGVPIQPSAPAPAPAPAPQNPQSGVPSNSGSLPRSPGFPRHPRSSFDMARADIFRRSRTPSRGTSPRLRSTSISAESGDPWTLGGRDENAFYQAETQMLIRENQMLRHRIRDLERQLAESTGNAGGGAPLSHEPSHSSNLNRSTSISEGSSQPNTVTPATSLPTVPDASKE